MLGTGSRTFVRRRQTQFRRSAACAAVIILSLSLSGCGDDDCGTASPTRTPIVSDEEPTPPPTPGPAGALHIELHNGAGNALTATLSGMRLSGPDANGAATAYGSLMPRIAGNGSAMVEPSGLAPGVWLHQITVTATGQQQYQQSLVIADPSAPNTLDWSLFATVLSVNVASDDGDGNCDQTCTLRDAVETANMATAPALIVFDHAALGNPADVMSIERSIDLTAAGLTIDGTDANGNPSPVADFGDRVYPTQITMMATKKPVHPPPSASCPCRDDFGGTLFASAAGVVFKGLHVVRVYPRKEADICCGDLTLIELGSGSVNSRVDTCLLDGGGRAITNAVTPMGETGQATSKDCVKPEQTGSTADQPIVVSNSELSYCMDRGVKVQNDFLRLENNWLHNNLRCSLFAIVPDGNIQAVGNLIEENGMNCPSGAPPNCTGQVVTRPDAPQVSAQGDSTQFELTGNVVRTGPLTGVYWQEDSTGTLTNTFVCGMRGAGILGERRTGSASGAVVRGTASVLNQSDGARFQDSVGADLGTDGGPNAGNNAFAGNPARAQVSNALRPTTPIAAQGNQWASCYPAMGATANQCDVSAIGDDDTNNTAGQFDKVDVENPQPQQNSGAVTLSAAAPTSVAEGRLVGITGSGFDAISGVAGLTSTDCARLAMTNTCSPLSGTCVEFLVDGVWTEAADVLGVTPTFVMVRSPFTCTAPTKVRVRRNVLGGSEAISNELDFCVN